MSEMKEWTLMFYFASDNPLAPSIVSQLKAIKQAGFHPEANVIARFDPHQDNTPAHIFDVNLVNKLKHPKNPQVGFDGRSHDDPFVQNLVLDKLWRNDGEDNKNRTDGDRNGNGERNNVKALIQRYLDKCPDKEVDNIVYSPPEPEPEMLGEQSPRKALESFLAFCKDNYPARRYMLFILGHGVVVGNDLFLLDEHVDEDEAEDDSDSRSKDSNSKRRRKNFLLLKDLADILGKQFKEKKGTRLELLGFHSCSMSSLEVAYELQGCANYMLASQGPAFVGSWPYKHILIRIFKELMAEREINVKETVKDIFYYCLYNSYDFQLAGYSFDLCLCDLKRVSQVTAPLSTLVAALNEGLSDSHVKESILLSHWEAQSFWQESYTDLYDFCFCLAKRCATAGALSEKTARLVEAVKEGCDHVMDALMKQEKDANDRLVVGADFAGPLYQYSHGLSLYFPWAKPANRLFEQEYMEYAFSKETKWHDFLCTYFSKTMRLTRAEDATKDVRAKAPASPSIEKKLLEEIAATIIAEDAQLSKGGPNDSTGGKGGANDPTGSDCDCPTIKNYPSLTRPRDGKMQSPLGLDIPDAYVR